MSPKVVFHVNLVLEEILTNIIAYGYADSDEHYISIGIFLAEGELVIQVADDGRPFNPLEAPEPDLESPLEERPVGGLGLHLVRSLMHEFEYERNEGQNLLVMKKRTTDLTGGRNQVGKGASL